MRFDHHQGYAFVTAILPRASTQKVLLEIMQSGVPNVMATSARGSLVQERWYQSLLPAISPEQEMLNLFVPQSAADTLMEQIVMVGNLRRSGAGAIFSLPCENLICSEDFPLWQPGQYQFVSESFDIQFKTGLSALLHVSDRGAADVVARAAIKAGAQGATITFIRGYGLRDRLGLLRITKSHDKELTLAVVDECDRDAVFEAMASTGKVEQPGRGIVYELPLSKGLTNLASVFQPHKHSASIQQMVRAIDELRGNADWRANHLLVHDPKAREFRASERHLSKDLKILNIAARRKDIETLLAFLLDYGVAGASVVNWRFTSRDCEQTRGGLRIHREFGCISVLLAPERLKPLCEALEETMTEHEMQETCHFTHCVPRVKTFSRLRSEEATTG
jgi:nitrogen regulatory protein PII